MPHTIAFDVFTQLHSSEKIVRLEIDFITIVTQQFKNASSYLASTGNFMRWFFWLMAALIVPCLGTSFLSAQDDAKEAELLAGHSYHGEAFNEGPRQKPYLMKGLGQSQFPITVSNSVAQTFFNQGIDQLHGFWYFEAERSFRQVAMIEPDCAMAYWGLAMANVNNEERAKKFLTQAEELSAADETPVTEREKLYIESLGEYYDDKVKDEKKRASNFRKKLEEIVLAHPDDLEAKAFLACQVWMNQRKGIKIASYIGIHSILDDIFEVNPDHPAHHYRIHLWDYENAEVALQSAAMCGPSLPDVAHMWHMPGHIYSRLKRYEDAVYQQEASARVDHRHMMHDWVLPDQIHNFAHNNEWCIRNLIHVGRVRDAVDLATNMISLPRHPKYNTLDERGSSRYGRQRLFQVLSTYEMWDELIHACSTVLAEESDQTLENIKRLRFLGRAYFRSGQIEDANRIHEQLDQLLENLESDKKQEEQKCCEAEQKTTDRYHQMVDAIADRISIPAAIRQMKNNVRRDHRIRVRKAVQKAVKEYEDQINVAKRALDELLGYELLRDEKYLEAAKKLKAAGQVDAVYRAYVRHLGGETEKAIEQARKFVKEHENEVQPQAMLSWLLWQAGQQDEAVKALGQLPRISNSIQHDLSFFEKLQPIVQHSGNSFNWKNEDEPANDLGDRPELDSLGPFRWQPISAPSWQLLDSDDELVSLNQFDGQPVIVVFYLGHGCLHCAEQLQAFAPKVEQFRAAGIEMVAISTDERDGLSKSIDSYGDQPLPIRLLADPELSVFRKYHAYDEFEEQPLHGTFLIDSNGKIRWQDISYEPFMDADFLLTESQRLLGQPVAR